MTEFYVYAEGDRVMGEVENIGPGLSRQLIVLLPEPGTYQTACKPGMVGDGIRADFTVTGEALTAPEEGSQLADAADGLQALRDEPGRRAGGDDRRVRRRR